MKITRDVREKEGGKESRRERGKEGGMGRVQRRNLRGPKVFGKRKT